MVVRTSTMCERPFWRMTERYRSSCAKISEAPPPNAEITPWPSWPILFRTDAHSGDFRGRSEPAAAVAQLRHDLVREQLDGTQRRGARQAAKRELADEIVGA